MHESEKWKWSRSVVSDSQWPHGLQPTRLLCPWDFPGKSTGVGCHCLLLQCFRFFLKMFSFAITSCFACASFALVSALYSDIFYIFEFVLILIISSLCLMSAFYFSSNTPQHKFKYYFMILHYRNHFMVINFFISEYWIFFWFQNGNSSAYINFSIKSLSLS